MEEWLACQRQWMYLVPIFLLSADIGNSLPVYYKKFLEVNQFWRKTMAAVIRTPVVFEFLR